MLKTYRILVTLVSTLALGMPSCNPSLPTLSVASENLIQTIEQWDVFIQANPLFILGMSDSTCAPNCCESEPLLSGLN